MTTDPRNELGPTRISIGIFAWNEEAIIESALRSLFLQSLFSELACRQLGVEVLCLVNGSTDRTAELAERFLRHRARGPAGAANVIARVVNLEVRGKLNAWNQFVHECSARSAQVLFMMDADISIQEPHALWNMYRALEDHAEAHVVVDRACKDIGAKSNKSVQEQLSLAASVMTQAAEAQLCAQLYAIRAGIARRLYMPRDLAACEDGYLKALVCTDLLEHEVWPSRICVAPGATHTFEAYTSLPAILRNQKRQIIGQTIVHLLIDEYLPKLPWRERRQLAETLKVRDAEDPDWLKRLIAAHLAKTRHCWQLYPDFFGHRIGRLQKLPWQRRLACLPAALASCGVALLAGTRARRSLKSGCTDYWPKAERSQSEHARATAAAAGLRTAKP